jgi:DNA-directed RNA polymerase subunit beta'
VQTPFDGIIKFNTNLVSPTCTCHKHPTWICHNDLSISIKSTNKICNLNVPPQSVLLVWNNQYIESKQIIAKIFAKISPFKEKVQRYFYSNSEGGNAPKSEGATHIHWTDKIECPTEADGDGR